MGRQCKYEEGDGNSMRVLLLYCAGMYNNLAFYYIECTNGPKII